MTKLHGVEWDVLRKAYKDRRDDITTRSKQAGRRIRKEIGDSYTPVWRNLYRKQFRERRSFDERETRLAGKIANAMDAIRHRRDIDPENSRRWMSAAFRSVRSQKAGGEVLEKVHKREHRELKRDQKQAVDRAMAEVRRSRKGFLDRALDTFSTERAALIARQDAEKAEMKDRWRAEYDNRTRNFGTIVQAAVYRKTAQAEATPQERFEACERGRRFRDAAEGGRKRAGRVHRRIRRRTEGLDSYCSTVAVGE